MRSRPKTKFQKNSVFSEHHSHKYIRVLGLMMLDEVVCELRSKIPINLRQFSLYPHCAFTQIPPTVPRICTPIVLRNVIEDSRMKLHVELPVEYFDFVNFKRLVWIFFMIRLWYMLNISWVHLLSSTSNF
jgi:hypothetical protein